MYTHLTAHTHTPIHIHVCGSAKCTIIFKLNQLLFLCDSVYTTEYESCFYELTFPGTRNIVLLKMPATTAMNIFQKFWSENEKIFNECFLGTGSSLLWIKWQYEHLNQKHPFQNIEEDYGEELLCNTPYTIT